MSTQARLKTEYDEKYKSELLKDDHFENVMDVPRFTKVVVNTGVGEATDNKGALEEAYEIIEAIAGQKPLVNKSTKAISNFKLREDLEIGVSATLRGTRMWEFFDKLVNVVLPRVKDFRGLSSKSFDGSGNYTVGFDDHTVFPEIDTSKNQRIRGLQVTIVTTANDDQGAKLFLDKFGFPFKEDGKKV